MLKQITSLIALLLTIPLMAQTGSDTLSTTVYAKVWKKVNGKNIYSDWKPNKTNTVDHLDDFEPADKPEFNKYGSNLNIKSKATGFYRTEKINTRWWIIDPDGYANWTVSINGVRQGKSERNKKELIKKYETVENWMNDTHEKMIDLGFNGTACWSEIPSILMSNVDSKNPLAYTMIWSFYSSYNKQKKTKELSFPVFDTEFEAFVYEKAKILSKTKDDPNLLGHFSDNELGFKSYILDEYLSLKDHQNPNYIAAANFLEERDLDTKDINDSIRWIFLGVVADKYFEVVSGAIKHYDPNHMYLGSRLHGKPKRNENILSAITKYADIVSLNYYGNWAPTDEQFAMWKKWLDKPFIITEFYTKGMDSGLANNSGAGWIVKTQKERGLHYQNFGLTLLEQEQCVGWHWFRYMDNDPLDKTADPSNNDSNKGIVDNNYNIYKELAEQMRKLNLNRYRLIEYFD